MPDELYLDQLADLVKGIVAPRISRGEFDYDGHETDGL